MPLVPRTQRQKAYARSRIFSYMPHPQTGFPQPTPME
jgi:hypothetical protein